jgi:hypothetical protein
MGTINLRVGLPLFQMEEGMVLTSFLYDGVLGFQG